MAYDQALSRRIHELLKDTPALVEKKMFGGVGFMIRGNMACGVTGSNLLVRLPPEQNKAALSKPYTQPFGLTGRVSAGWIEVTPQGIASDADLQEWVDQAVRFVLTLPAK
jgi:TfoX/Sxy family transcriptional regulator of competence genes